MDSASSSVIEAFRATLDLFQTTAPRLADRATGHGIRRLSRASWRRRHPIRVTTLETALRQICVDLTETRSSFALVGGLAVSALRRDQMRSPSVVRSALTDSQGFYTVPGLALGVNTLTVGSTAKNVTLTSAQPVMTVNFP